LQSASPVKGQPGIVVAGVNGPIPFNYTTQNASSSALDINCENTESQEESQTGGVDSGVLLNGKLSHDHATATSNKVRSWRSRDGRD